MSKRHLPHVNIHSVLDRLADCRQAMIELRSGSPARSLGRAAADQMISNIDELVWIITGDRDLLKLKGHGRREDHELPSSIRPVRDNGEW